MSVRQGNKIIAAGTNYDELVHKTGVETISDTKILNNGHIQLRSNSLSATEKTSTSTQMSHQFIRLHDIDDRATGELSIKRTGNIGDTMCCLYAHNTTDGNDSWSELAIHATDDGRQFATCPSPAIDSNDNKIVNTSWFNNKIQVVSSLPANPDANVFYFVKE